MVKGRMFAFDYFTMSDNYIRENTLKKEYNCKHFYTQDLADSRSMHFHHSNHTLDKKEIFLHLFIHSKNVGCLKCDTEAIL